MPLTRTSKQTSICQIQSRHPLNNVWPCFCPYRSVQGRNRKKFITFVHNLCPFFACFEANRWIWTWMLMCRLFVFFIAKSSLRSRRVCKYLWKKMDGREIKCKDLIEMNDNFDRNKLDWNFCVCVLDILCKWQQKTKNHLKAVLLWNFSGNKSWRRMASEIFEILLCLKAEKFVCHAFQIFVSWFVTSHENICLSRCIFIYIFVHSVNSNFFIILLL